MPRHEHRLTLRAALFQITLPAPDHEGIEVLRFDDLAEGFLRVLFQLELRQQVLLHRSPNPGRLFLPPQLHGVLQLQLANMQFLVKGGVCCRFGAGNELLRAVLEHAIQGVVVARGDGVELVIVTACAPDREPHGASHHDIDTVVNDIVGDPQETPSQCEKAHRSQVR